ncbi:Oidioi.mRNA.OKI2018_I69.PAR.g12860.t1.cds [Oikopleura dioica]|uniref:Oidioi.mRNA.OKI2018_I69.PAR.g12860.t1.cds n=1 Tax=Oikopleura dioica TaxID=34765 RepID=A0ABN7S201_OIKDI|nr:Oidioi.mRNA.OKI2018_I69.PAR.g12860.t1.cds [Oikopleura dioica]
MLDDLVDATTANDSTAKLATGLRICQSCVSSERYKWILDLGPIEFKPSDATFKCAAKDSGCSEDQLTFEEYWIGACCNKAAQRNCNSKDAHLANVQKIYERVRGEEENAEKAAKQAKIDLIDAEQALEEAKKAVTETEETRVRTKDYRRKVQKRHLFLSEIAMKEDNEDLAEMTFVNEAKLSDKLKCKVCNELFNDVREETIITSCSHKLCSVCYTSLEQKNCPFCRKRFAASKVVKVFDL